MSVWRRCLAQGCDGEVVSRREGIVCEYGHSASRAGGWYVVEDERIVGLGHPHAPGYLRQPGDPVLEGCCLAVALLGGQAARVVLTAYTVVVAGDPGRPAARVTVRSGERETYVLTYREDGSTALLDLGEPVRILAELQLLRGYRAARRRAFAPASVGGKSWT